MIHGKAQCLETLCEVELIFLAVISPLSIENGSSRSGIAQPEKRETSRVPSQTVTWAVLQIPVMPQIRLRLF